MGFKIASQTKVIVYHRFTFHPIRLLRVPLNLTMGCASNAWNFRNILLPHSSRSKVSPASLFPLRGDELQLKYTWMKKKWKLKCPLPPLHAFLFLFSVAMYTIRYLMESGGRRHFLPKCRDHFFFVFGRLQCNLSFWWLFWELIPVFSIIRWIGFELTFSAFD